MSSFMLEYLTDRQSFCPEEHSTLIANPLLICLPQAAFPAQERFVSQCPYFMRERLHWQQVGHPKRPAWRKQ